jgi:hypothetical protein
MKITVEYRIYELECEATIDEEGQESKHLLSVTLTSLLRRVEDHIRQRMLDEGIND